MFTTSGTKYLWSFDSVVTVQTKSKLYTSFSSRSNRLVTTNSDVFRPSTFRSKTSCSLNSSALNTLQLNIYFC
uniref:Uncharacterized protein n=1 Tax=Scleropages formosus TaxID=113540 RepID=A0A8C9RNJ5_SCLFO